MYKRQRPEPYPRGTREWVFTAHIADQMALVLIQMARSGVNSLTEYSHAYKTQSQALLQLIPRLVPGSEAEALWMHLVSGSSAQTYPQKTKKEKNT